MPNVTDSIIDQATSWQLQQPTLDAAGWERFVAWLEADRAHAAAFDRVALADRLIADARSPEAVPALAPAGIRIEPMRGPRPASARRRTIGWSAVGMAVAASVVALLVPAMLPRADARYTLTTAPGEHRTVALGDGTSIAMNGDTRLRLDRSDPRVAALDHGQATFRVRHDDGKPFTLTAGGIAVRDMGTVFDVTRASGRLDVRVAEGSVLFQPDGDALVLKRGQALSVDERTLDRRQSVVSPDQVGGWQQGQLAFEGETLPVVVAALERQDGARITLAAPLSRQIFTGMVSLSGSAERDIPHLATLIGARWRRNGEQWVLAP